MSKSRGKKVLLWILLFVLVGSIAIAAVYGAYQMNHRKSEMAETIRKNPDTTAVVAYTFNEQGEPVEDGKALFYNSDTPLVMASTMKIVVLAAYEDAVARGELNPGEQVLITDLEKYYLPRTDGGAHSQGLASLGLKADANGFARDQTTSIRLDDIARIMIHYSGNAETDYLLARLRADQIEAVVATIGMKHQTPLHSILGITLAMFNHEAPLTNTEQRQILIRDIADGNFGAMGHLENLYLLDQNWRAAQIAFMQSDAFVAAAGQMGWDGQVESSQLFPKGTAREYARLLAKIASGQFTSPEVSSAMQEKLESVPAEWPLRLLFYRRFGAKDGVTAGVLSLASYAVPKYGPMAGRGRVVVILTNDLSYETWSRQVQSEGIFLLQTDLARATGVFRELVDSQ
jgi:D-alanyl-D-alanine carboxypeptidase